MGEMQHEHALVTTEAHKGVAFGWGSSNDGARSLASSILDSCMGDLVVDPKAPEDLVLAFTRDIISRQAPDKPFYLPWLDVHRWLSEAGIPEAADLVALVEKVERVEGQINEAVASKAGQDLFVDPQLWREWALRTLLGVVIAKRRCQPNRLPHFIDQLLDVKFKLYCVLEVDLPAYAAAIQAAGLSESDPSSTPQGHLTRLSSEATVAVKTRRRVRYAQRHCSHPGLVWQSRPLPAQPRRQPPTQRRPTSHRHYSDAIGRSGQELHRQTRHER
jgi:hypothetical protein